MMYTFKRLAGAFEKSEERAQATSDKHLEALRHQFEDMTKDLYRMMEGKIHMMEVEMTDSRKRSIQGKGKVQIDQDNFLP